MATVIGVRFKKASKLYYFDPTDVWPQPSDFVVVETTRGVELGEVVTGAREVPDDQITAPLKRVMRIASSEDVERCEQNTEKEKEAFKVCQEKILKHKLSMKLVDAEFTFDNSKLIFYFTANGRVDFRELVRDLAAVFKVRIELRQIGVRDEAKMIGGLGACGRSICCGTFLRDFQPVSIKMAKEQNLSLNPTKISGQCGRLMCCLKYEHDNYKTVLKQLPKPGKAIETPDGEATLLEISVTQEKVKVRLRLSGDAYEIREYGLDEVSKVGVRQRPLKEADTGQATDADTQPSREETITRQGDEPVEVAQKNKPQVHDRGKESQLKDRRSRPGKKESKAQLPREEYVQDGEDQLKEALEASGKGRSNTIESVDTFLNDGEPVFEKAERLASADALFFDEDDPTE